jgi:hypothetical protein
MVNPAVSIVIGTPLPRESVVVPRWRTSRVDVAREGC